MGIYEQNSLPMGFGMALAMDLDAMKRFSDLTEAEKEEMLNQARDAKSKREMENIVANLHQDSIF